jgi:hypothetical protein
VPGEVGRTRARVTWRCDIRAKERAICRRSLIPLKSNATRDWRVGGWRVKSVRGAGWAGPARSWWRDQVVKG